MNRADAAPTPAADADADANDADARRRGLRRMKRLALALLVAAAALYGVAQALQPRHPAWGYVAAFAEAAMVGALADWFAVVALFRHPLGLPIPHTAIVPNSRGRIGRNLADFLAQHFLSTPQVLERLRQARPGARLAGWLADPTHADQVAAHAAGAARFGLQALDHEAVRTFLHRAVVQQLETLDVAPLAGELLSVLTAEGRHQAVLDEVLRELAALLEDESLQARVAEHIAAEVKLLRYVGLDAIAGKAATKRIVAGVGKLIGEMGDDPQHELRLRFDAYMAGFVERLRHDPALALKGRALRDEVLRHPALAAWLGGLWQDALTWLHDDLARDDSTTRRRVAQAVRSLGGKLAGDAAMQDWIDAQLLAAAPALIGRWRDSLHRGIVERVDRWDAGELTRELETHLGRDLQFVRINGTVVGGLAGLGIHALTRWLGG